MGWGGHREKGGVDVEENTEDVDVRKDPFLKKDYFF